MHVIMCNLSQICKRSISDATPTSFAVKEDSAFSFSGVEFPGPLMIHTEGPKKTSKALFTCFVTRAVDLDIVLDMSTETFIS